MEKNQEEIFFRLSIFEQQIKQYQEQLQAIEQAIIESSSLKIDLDELKNSEGKEILASIGKGIFAKAKLTSDDFLVDIGGKNFVKKNIGETQNLIEGQIEKLSEIKRDIENSLEEINKELTEFFEENQPN